MKKVALVGFSKSTRMQAPFDDPEVEIWGLNEGYVRETPRITRWFQLHNFATFSRDSNTNDPLHYQWLKSKHDFPIYMQKKYPMVPNCMVYPLQKAINKFGLSDGNQKRLYATSSFSYMMYLAMLEGFEWIGVYGFEMATGSEYFHQRANAEYIIGIAQGMGIQIGLPENGNLLRGRMYAYEDESLGLRQQLEFRLGVLKHQQEKQNRIFLEKEGYVTALEELAAGKVQLNEEVRAREQNALISEMATANVIQGAIEEVQLMLRIYDNQNGSAAVEDELKKEIE